MYTLLKPVEFVRKPSCRYIRNSIKYEYYCGYCSRIFSKSYNLMIHERSHHSHVCEICYKSYKNKDSLSAHRAQHSPSASSDSSSSSSSSSSSPTQFY